MRTTCLTAAILCAIPCTLLRAQDPAPASPTTAPAPAAAPEDANRVLDQLLRAKPGSAKPIQPATMETQRSDRSVEEAIAPNVPDVPLKHEGDLLPQRIVRLQKSKNGIDWELHFDAGAKAVQDPPLLALENRALMRMQELQKNAGRDLRFRVNGLITEYRGRNYLLIERAVVDEDSIDR